MPPSISITIPCRADEPDLRSMLDSLWRACQSAQVPADCIQELCICINGVTEVPDCPPLQVIRDFCAQTNIVIREVELAPEGGCSFDTLQTAPESFPLGVPTCTVLLTPWRGKPRAMNALWQRAHGELLLFCDADVRVDPQAIAHLYNQMEEQPHVRLAAAREVPVLGERARIWSHMGALPYRFNFGNAGGRLFLIRKDALADPMPEDLLLEDAWLTVAVEKQYVRKVLPAQVFFVLPQTWQDYFAERIRAEGGKIQIRRHHGHLLEHGPIAQYAWKEFLRQIEWHEYGLVVLALGVRILAHMWAWVRLKRSSFYTLYRPFTSTKYWSSSAQESTDHESSTASSAASASKQSGGQA